MARLATKGLEITLAFREKLARLGRDESGASAIEYALIVGLIAVALVTALTDVGDQVASLFETVKSKISGADSGS